MILDSCNISSSGVSSKEERKIASLVNELGGTYSSDLFSNTFCLLVKRVGTKKQQIAISSSVPTIEFKWLEDCKSAKKRLEFTNYLVRPFLGLCICCTGYSPEERFIIQKIVEENGGVYSSTLVRDKVTHLIAEEASDEGKFAFAKMWGNVHIVTKKWIDDCVSSKCENFFIPDL